MIASGVAVVISVAIMMCNMMVTVRVATLFFHLTGRHVAIAPTLFLALVPTCGTLVGTVMITIAIMAAISVTIVVTVFVFVLVLLVAAMAVSMATFGVGAWRQRHAQYKSEQKL
jgi:hypothetical protein